MSLIIIATVLLASLTTLFFAVSLSESDDRSFLFRFISFIFSCFFVAFVLYVINTTEAVKKNEVVKTIDGYDEYSEIYVKLIRLDTFVNIKDLEYK